MPVENSQHVFSILTRKREKNDGLTYEIFNIIFFYHN